MRKIKELEERIAILETTIAEIKRKELDNQEVRRNWHIAILDRLAGIEAKQKEQEEFLDGTVIPSIGYMLSKEIVESIYDILDVPSKLFTEESNKKTQKEPKDEKKKVGRPKQNKEKK